MGREVNEVDIRKLEKKIEEGMGNAGRLKRARNTLLNISIRVPPELLGYIFLCIVGDHNRLHSLHGACYRFLFVCHRWYHVARSTPELWTFWGHKLAHWLSRFDRSGALPVDLTLSGFRGGSTFPVCRPLLAALRDHAERDIVRSLNLWSERKGVLTEVLEALTPDENQLRVSSLQTMALRYVDASAFMARTRFPRLTYLNLASGTHVTDWPTIANHTMALTTLALTLENDDVPSLPSIPELLCLLGRNPHLCNVTISCLWTVRIEEHSPIGPIPMHALKKISIEGGHRSVYHLLRRLHCPQSIDHMFLTTAKSGPRQILDTLGRAVRQHLRHERKFRSDLGIELHCLSDYIQLQASDTTQSADRMQRRTFATFQAHLSEDMDYDEYVQLCRDLMACVPTEEVVYFGGEMAMDIVKQLASMLPNITDVHLVDVEVQTGFLQPDEGGINTKLFPSLQNLCLEDVFPLERGSWQPLREYVAQQTAEGQQISLTIIAPHGHICGTVLREIRALVTVFEVSNVLEGT
jgi:hypothetical protein